MRKEWQCHVLTRVERNEHSPALLIEVCMFKAHLEVNLTLFQKGKKIFFDIAILVPGILRINIETYLP